MDKKSDAYRVATWLSEKKTIEEMLGELFLFQDRGTFLNEYDLYEVCKDKIRSKKDKFRPIKVALKHLIEKRSVVKKINRFGEPVYRSSWNELMDRLAKGELETQKWTEGEQEKKVRMSYNILYGTSIPDRWSNPGEFAKLTENQQWHYFEFSDGAFRLIKETGNIDSFIPRHKRIFESYQGNKKGEMFNQENKRN
jgi:hypothetical protein